MHGYKYTVHLQATLDDAVVDIYEDNIISVIIDYDYHSEVVMPVVMVKLRLDKNLLDYIIENKDKARMILKICKVDTLQDVQTEIQYINTVCTYELMDDTYNDKSTLYDRNSGREDVYAETIIGLISEDCVERNVKNNDCVLKDGNFLGAIAYFCSHMPLVVEPFTYNKEFDQFIVPPLESIKQLIRFFYNISVFYDTPLRFFNDFHRVYLLSSSGNPIPVIGEPSSTVVITLRKPDRDTDDALTLGITYNEEGQYYDMKVITNDAVYNQNNLTDKDFNKFVGVLDPSREMSLPALISNVVQQAGDAVASLNNTIMTNVGDISQGANNAIQGSNQVTYSSGIIRDTTAAYVEITAQAQGRNDALLDKYYNALKQALAKQAANSSGSSGSGSGSSGASANKYLARYNSAKGKVSDLNSVPEETESYLYTLAQGKVNVNGVADIATQGAYSMVSYQSLYDGVKIEDIPRNIETMEAKEPINQTYTDLINSRSTAANGYMGDSHSGESASTNKTLDNLDYSIETIEYFYDELKKIYSSMNSGGNNGQGGGNTATCPITESEHKRDMEELNGYKGTVVNQQQTMESNFGSIQECIANDISFGGVMENTLQQAIPSVDTLVGTLVEGLAGAIFGGGIGAIWDVFNNNLARLVTQTFTQGLAELGISSLAQLSDISKIFDLSSVAKTGITSITSNKLKILDSGGSDKIKYIDLGNDDPNRIKVMESEINLGATTFSCTKENIDNSILTLNKEYIVQNVDEKSNMNGRYLLHHKQEIYVREDTLFNSKTILDFVKVPE